MAGWEPCPTCGLAPVRKHGRDRRGQQVYECTRCGRSFTHRSGTPFSGYRYGDLAEWLAERGVHVDGSTLYDWVQHFTPLYQDAARPHRQQVVLVWSVDETYVRVGKA